MQNPRPPSKCKHQNIPEISRPIPNRGMPSPRPEALYIPKPKSSKQNLPRMFNLKSMLPQLPLLPPLLILALIRLLHYQPMDLSRRRETKWGRDIFVFVEILKCIPKTVHISIPFRIYTWRMMGGIVEGKRTISPRSNTFSPLTRNMPRGISLYMSFTNIRSMVSWRTRFATLSCISPRT